MSWSIWTCEGVQTSLCLGNNLPGYICITRRRQKTKWRGLDLTQSLAVDLYPSQISGQMTGFTSSLKRFVSVYENVIFLLLFIKQIEEQIGRQPQDEEAHRLWMKLKSGVSQFFEGATLFPSLLHGDLWSGNMAQSGPEPVIFDPASFYGHHEYDLAIGKMFGGFGSEFYKSYHDLIPKEPGFESRGELYQLFHCLNHWNLFGDGNYRSQSLGIMRKLLKCIK